MAATARPPTVGGRPLNEVLDGPMKTWRALAFAFLLAASIGFSQRYIYQAILVPQLPNVDHVPLGWWLLVYLPQLLICIAAGFTFRHWIEAATFSVVGAVLVACTQLYMQAEHWPGFVNGGGIYDSPLIFLSSLIAIYVIASGMHLVRAGLRRAV
jgi:hypothetical protein